MTGKALTSNMVKYLSGAGININIYKFDLNTEKVLPCIVVGYDSETLSFPGGQGHFTVGGYVNVCYQGYDDRTNTNADETAKKVLDAIANNAALFTSVNKPLTGTDTRPLTGFNLNGFFLTGVDRSEEGTSEEISIKFDAYCVPKDF